MMLTLITKPAVEPILIDEVKDYCRIDGDVEDALISDLMIAAREHLDGRDGWLNRALITQTWDWTIDRFPTGHLTVLKLPLPPLISVTSITYQSDGSPTEETYSSGSYTANTAPQPGEIYPNYGTSWPSALWVPNAVTVRFVAGYGTSWNDIPAPIRRAMMALVRHWYDNRDGGGEMPDHVDAMLASYRIRTF